MSRYGYSSVAASDDDDVSMLRPPSSTTSHSTPRGPRSRTKSPTLTPRATPAGPRLQVRTPSPSPVASPSSLGALKSPGFDADFEADSWRMSAASGASAGSSAAHSRASSSTSLLPQPSIAPPPYASPTPSRLYSEAPLPPLPTESHSPSPSIQSLPSDYSDGDSDGEHVEFIPPRHLPNPVPRRGQSLLRAEPPTPNAYSAAYSPYSVNSSALPPSTVYSMSPNPSPYEGLPPATERDELLDVPAARPRFPRTGTASSSGSGSGVGHRRGYQAAGSAGDLGWAAQTNESSMDFSAGSRPGSTAADEKFDAYAYTMHLGPEEDDALHDPRVKFTGVYTRFAGVSVFTARGFMNIGCLFVLVFGITALFLIYPLHLYFADHASAHSLVGSGANGVGVNASGQVPVIGNFGLIDLETPQDAYTMPGFYDSSETMQLVFSDEFETEGRTFYPGDDPYWEAVDLHYWQTGDLEWYDPSAITTRAGALEINLTQVEDISNNHNLSYRSGMMSTWNKFCFTGGLVLANVMLPGATNVFGLWPAVWTMGNLGRAGYGASLDGMWPYSYDECDVGAAPNQSYAFTNSPSYAGLTGPAGATDSDGAPLSFLPGQRLSRCVCKGESHPGPTHNDGTFVGRSAPEIDVFEALISTDADGGNIGRVSQSAQWAPFNADYEWDNATSNYDIPEPSISDLNGYLGGQFQQATSVITTTNQSCYQLSGPQCYTPYGIEYTPGYSNAYISWINNGAVSWTLLASGVGSDANTQISARPITSEPMYLIMNLGISEGFGFVDFEHLRFPASMRVDWIRVYQKEGSVNVGCEPDGMPTQAYINEYIEAYTNPNFTTWTDDFGQTVPKNSLAGDC
ncbi:GH16 domain-containing protein [Mycena chlorophos]|uniref:GH16 domain-containing protein n=1 Tax=Mycena chlorophos TaxID=658473 RepID=A0A8H6VU70_MYCCL|nr:GH16 domain-containing protein [Mycena chlorophos]